MNVMNGGSVMAPAVPPPGTFPPGTQIQLGQYSVVIERYIAEGGFAHVYVASLLGGQPSTVVVKRIAVADKERLAIVNNEIETMKRLGNHKNIVEYMDSTMGKLEGGGYEVLILMENCTGGPVIDIMNRRLQHRLTEPEILKIFSNVCEAVAYMHYQDPPVLHRDIKVENILLSNNQYKLCDFGSATTNILRGNNIPKTVKEIQLLEEDINNHTTLQYRAPEMLDLYMRKGIDEKIDIWALGVLLYKLCYYTTPFEEQGQLAILNARYTIPDQPMFSHELKGLIRSILKEEPSQRPNIYQLLQMTSAIRGLPCPIQNKYPETSFSSATNPAASQMAASMDIFTTAPMARPMDALPSIAPMRRGRPTRSPAPGSTPNQTSIDSFPSSGNTNVDSTLNDGFGSFPPTTDFKAGFDDSFGVSVPAASTSSADGFDFGGSSSNNAKGTFETGSTANFSLGFEEPKTNVGEFGFKSSVPAASTTNSKPFRNGVASGPGSPSKGPRPMSALGTPSTSSKPTAMDLLLNDSGSPATSASSVPAPSAQLTGPSLQARLRSLGLGGGDVTNATNSSRAGSGSGASSLAHSNISHAQSGVLSTPIRPPNVSHHHSSSNPPVTMTSNLSAISTKYPPLADTMHDNLELLQRQQLEQFGQFSTESSRAPDNRGRAKVLDPSKTLDGLKQQSSSTENSSSYRSSTTSTPVAITPEMSDVGLGASAAPLVPHGSRPGPRSSSPLPTTNQGTSIALSSSTTSPTVPARSSSSETTAVSKPPPKPSHSHSHSQSGSTVPSLKSASASKVSDPVKFDRAKDDDGEIQRIRDHFERQRRDLFEQQQRQMELQQREHRLQQARLQELQMRELQQQQEKWLTKRRAQKEHERQQQQESQLSSQLSGRSITSASTSSSLANHYGSSPSSSILSSSTTSSMMLNSQQSPTISATFSPSTSVTSLASTLTNATTTTASVASAKKPWAGGNNSTYNGESSHVPRTAYQSSSSSSNGTPTAPPRSTDRPRAVMAESTNATGSTPSSAVKSAVRSRGTSVTSNPPLPGHPGSHVTSPLPPGKKPELMPKPTRFRMKDGGAGSLAVGEEEAFKRRFPSADDFDLDGLIEATVTGGSSSSLVQSGGSARSTSTRPSLDQYRQQHEEEEEEEEILSRPPRRAHALVKDYERVSAPASGLPPSSPSFPRKSSAQYAQDDGVETDGRPAESVRERVQRMNRGGRAD